MSGRIFESSLSRGHARVEAQSSCFSHGRASLIMELDHFDEGRGDFSEPVGYACVGFYFSRGMSLSEEGKGPKASLSDKSSLGTEAV